MLACANAYPFVEEYGMTPQSLCFIILNYIYELKIVLYIYVIYFYFSRIFEIFTYMFFALVKRDM